MTMNKLRIVATFAIFSALVCANSSFASSTPPAKLGSHCTRPGISALSQGQVIFCSAGVWKLKGGIKIGTNNTVQSVLADPCDNIGTYGEFNDIAYVCTRTPTGNRWEIAASVHTATKMVPQDIYQKNCETIGLVTILNGTSYTCTYGQGSGQWQQTNLVQISTSLRKKKLDGTKCGHLTDVTMLNGSYYYCSGSSSKNATWVKYNPTQFPKVIQDSAVQQANADLSAQLAAARRAGNKPVLIKNGSKGITK